MIAAESIVKAYTAWEVMNKARTDAIVSMSGGISSSVSLMLNLMKNGKAEQATEKLNDIPKWMDFSGIGFGGTAMMPGSGKVVSMGNVVQYLVAANLKRAEAASTGNEQTKQEANQLIEDAKKMAFYLDDQNAAGDKYVELQQLFGLQLGIAL